MGKPFTSEEDRIILQRKKRGESYDRIASYLGRTSTVVFNRYHALTDSPEKRQAFLAKRARWRRNERAACIKTTIENHQVESIIVPPETWAARDARLAAPKSLTGWICGDPPRGFSALDQRVSA